MRMSRSLIFALVVFFLLWMVWSRLRFVVFIPMSPWQALLFFAIAAVVLYLVIEHFINRER